MSKLSHPNSTFNIQAKCTLPKLYTLLVGLAVLCAPHAAAGAELAPVDPGVKALPQVIDNARTMRQSLDRVTLHTATAKVGLEAALAARKNAVPGSFEESLANQELARTEDELLTGLVRDLEILAPQMAKAEAQSRKIVKELVRDPNTYRAMTTAYIRNEQSPSLLALAAFAQSIKLKRATERLQYTVIQASLTREYDKVLAAYALLQDVAGLDPADLSMDDILHELESEGLTPNTTEVGDPLDAMLD